MTNKNFGVLIIEDDFRIADINRQFIEQAKGFHVVARASCAQEALECLSGKAADIDLVLLDAYLPDVQGLELLWEIRRLYRHLEIVMVTAAKEVETIQEALRGGIFDYLIKPVEQERMQQMLQRFCDEHSFMALKQEVSQHELDQALRRSSKPSGDTRRLPKGIDRLTLDRLLEILQQHPGGMTALQLAEASGVSRSTARRYLEYLVAEQQLHAELDYGEVGRPERCYRLI
ncbi:response regulator [Marinospirillum alkaliphilum]|uniref:Transcriptional regulatory protein n=1 Tax=Marinospirillum alkaliphilum DSM 21637 TaxID=1122209 RepID=A0A1K1UHE6_9GAMM|nr:response regulator [Marinospirillum alkaliphilum]SFX12465.1 two-component system, CitB family, response regulator CitT [Marinospirillum alkaliphilum DSM 21637]